MAPQESQICGGNFQKRKKSAVELCQILRMVTIEIVISSTRVMGVRVTISCQYCVALEVMLLVSSSCHCYDAVQVGHVHRRP